MKRKIKRFNEGGISEEEDKRAGLKASEKEDVGFFKRLAMGNIDDPSSEAYKRFGAGRGKSERAAKVPVEDRTPVPVERKAEPPTSDAGQDAMRSRAIAEGNRREGDASVAEAFQGKRSPAPATAPAPAAPKAAAAKPSMGAYPDETKRGSAASGRIATGIMSGRGGQGGPTAEELENYRQKKPPSKPLSLEDRVSQIPAGSDKAPVEGEKVEPYTTGKKILNTMGALGPSRLAGLGLMGMEMKGAKAVRQAEMAKKARKTKLSKELREGQTPTKFTSKAKPSKATKKFNEDELGVEFKRGGRVSSFSKASSRADGIALRGKTRGINVSMKGRP